MRSISCSAGLVPRASGTSDPFNFGVRRSQGGLAFGGSTERLRIPCFSAFLHAAALPISVLGPVERLALARFACSLRSEIGRLTPCIVPWSNPYCWLGVIRPRFLSPDAAKPKRSSCPSGRTRMGGNLNRAIECRSACGQLKDYASTRPMVMASLRVGWVRLVNPRILRRASVGHLTALLAAYPFNASRASGREERILERILS